MAERDCFINSIYHFQFTNIVIIEYYSRLSILSSIDHMDNNDWPTKKKMNNNTKKTTT